MLETLPGEVISFDFLREKGGNQDSRKCFKGTSLPMVVMLDRDRQIVGFLSKALAEKFNSNEKLGPVVAQFSRSQNDPSRTFWFLRKPITSSTEKSMEEVL